MHKITIPLNIILSILLLLIIARIFADIAVYRIAGPFKEKSPALAAKQAVQGKQDSVPAVQPISAIVEKGLFGPATKGVFTPMEQSAKTSSATTAQSDLLLLGTATGASSASGFILIRKISSNEEKVFKLGEKVFELGTLTEVQKDMARISTGAQKITLRVPNNAQVGTSNPTTPSQTSSGVIQPSSTPGIIDQRALNAALDNIGQAMTDARLLPSLKDGKTEGFRISEVKPQGVFASVGLKNGDVLVRINDFPIDSPEKAIQSFVALKGQNRIKLDLIRDNAPTTLSYEIR